MNRSSITLYPNMQDKNTYLNVDIDGVLYFMVIAGPQLNYKYVYTHNSNYSEFIRNNKGTIVICTELHVILYKEFYDEIFDYWNRAINGTVTSKYTVTL